MSVEMGSLSRSMSKKFAGNVAEKKDIRLNESIVFALTQLFRSGPLYNV